jgi:hypothetical protein
MGVFFYANGFGNSPEILNFISQSFALNHLLVSRRIGDMPVAATVNICVAASIWALKRFF